jgi:3-oxoadipate enol-lactonase
VATVRLNGIDFCFERRGEGPRLLFVNGSGATLASMAPLLDAFAARFELLAHDQRGLGRTEIPPGPYSMSDYGNDASALAASVGWDTYRVVGISFGGMVAQELAVTFPERIERLALLCTSAGGAGGSSYPLHMLGALNPEARAAAGSSMVDTRFTPEWLEAHDDDRMLMAGRDEPKTTDVARGESLQLAARAEFDVFHRLPRIACPTLVAAGRYDGIAPVANSEAIAGQIPGATLSVYEGGHTFFAQDPRAIPEVLSFLEG